MSISSNYNNLNVAFLRTLVEHNADVFDKDKDGMTALHWAVMSGNVEDFVPLVKAGVDINSQNNEGQTPLHLAAKLGYVYCLRPLYTLGANLDLPETKNKETPLHTACLNKHSECVEELIALGANVHAQDKKGNAPLHQAPNFRILRHLINGQADINANNQRNCTPLLQAVANKNYYLAQCLLNEGADPLVLNRNGQSLLNLSVLQKPPVFLAGLLDKYTFDGLGQNVIGNTALHAACITGNLLAVELLLRKYPGVKDIKNDFGQTALDLAIAKQQDDIIRLLMKAPDLDCTTLKGYGCKIGDISQNKLIKQLKKYLELKQRDTSYFEDRGSCAASSFLFCYYAALGKTAQYKQLETIMADWDGREESLKDPVNVPDLIEPYTNVAELFEQWINDITWIQHSTESVMNILSIKQRNLKKIFNIVKPLGSSLNVYTPKYMEKKTFGEWQEHISLAALYPKIRLLHKSIDHAMASLHDSVTEKIFFDPNSSVDYVNIASLKSFPETLHKRFFVSDKFDDKMRLEIPFFSFDALSSTARHTVPACPENEWTPMHVAVLYNDMQLLQECVDADEAPKEINAADKSKRTPLHYAAMYANLEAANLLLENKADIDVVDDQGHTPLMCASLRGAYKVVGKLIAAGAQVNLKDPMGRTALHFASESKAKIARLLIENGATVDAVDEQGHTPLFFACYAEAVECIQALKSKGADLNFKDNNGNTPLYAVIKNDAIKTAKELIKLGAEVNVVNDDGITPLHMSAGFNRTKFMKLLLDKKADINAQDNIKNTPLHYAVSHSSLKSIKILLQKGAKLSENINMMTPFHQSVTLKPLLAAIFLQHGVDANLTTSLGITPLAYAAAAGIKENIELLLHYNADINAPNKEGQPPLFFALSGKHFDTAAFILTKNPQIKITDQYSQTALSLACQMGATDVVRVLIEQGADLNSCITSGQTPLFAAFYNQHYGCFKQLVDHDADINHKDNSGETLLHHIAGNKQSWVMPFAEHLLKQPKLDKHAISPFGVNAFHLACAIGNLNFVKLLDRYDPCLRHTLTARKKTPLEIAQSCKQKEIVDYLIESVKI